MYESFYRLKEKPFSLLPDTGYLYLSRKHGTALALLEYCLLRQDGFCVISGEAGVGKTTLIRRLLAQHSDRFTIGLISNTQGSLGELLGWISIAFGLEYQGRTRSQLYEDFLRFLADQRARDRQTVLIIDEAQNISPAMVAELRVLSKPNTGSGTSLKTILVGQSQLLATLRAPGLEQFAKHIAVDYHLGPLGRDETGEYIRYRLSVAGGDPGLFDDEACDAVFHYSGGIPRLINLLCDNALASAHAMERAAVGADIVHAVMRDREARGTLPQFGVWPVADELQQKESDAAWAFEALPALKHGVAGGVLPAVRPTQPGLKDESAETRRDSFSKLVSMEKWPRNERRKTMAHQVTGAADGRSGPGAFVSRLSRGTADVLPVSPARPSSVADWRRQATGPEDVSPDNATDADHKKGGNMENYGMVPIAADRRSRVYWGVAIMMGFIAGLLVAAILLGAVYLSSGRRASPAGHSRASMAPHVPVVVLPPVAAPAVPAVPPASLAAEKSRLRELRNERNAAIAEARTLQKERDAALAVAKARERAAQAELRAALAQERAQAVLRQRLAEEKVRRVVVPVAVAKSTAKAPPQIRRPAPVPAAATVPKILKFSPNPCNGPAAKFLSTCKE
ncbi:MAG: AAA family ATPase [Acidiferrobacterales bacterium]